MARRGVIGADAACKALVDLASGVRREIGKRQLLSAAERLREEAAARAPVLTGALRASIRVGDAMAGKSGLAIVADDEAAVPVEYGTGDTPMQPFFRPAIDAEIAAMREIGGRDIVTAVNRIASRVAGSRG